MCGKNSRDGSSSVARLLKVGYKDANAEGVRYETPKASSGKMPKASRRYGMGRGFPLPS